MISKGLDFEDVTPRKKGLEEQGTETADDREEKKEPADISAEEEKEAVNAAKDPNVTKIQAKLAEKFN